MASGGLLEVAIEPGQRRRIDMVAIHRKSVVDEVREIGPGHLLATIRKL